MELVAADQHPELLPVLVVLEAHGARRVRAVLLVVRHVAREASDGDVRHRAEGTFRAAVRE